MRRLFLLIASAVTIGATSGLSLHAQADVTVPRCFRLGVGAWNPTLGADVSYHVVPAVIRLDTVARGARGRRLEPAMSYPFGRPFPETPRWEAAGDTVRLIWSNGYAATLVTLVRRGEELVGEAVAQSDVRFDPEPPRPRATITARPVACEERNFRPAL